MEVFEFRLLVALTAQSQCHECEEDLTFPTLIFRFKQVSNDVRYYSKTTPFSTVFSKQGKSIFQDTPTHYLVSQTSGFHLWILTFEAASFITSEAHTPSDNLFIYALHTENGKAHSVSDVYKST